MDSNMRSIALATLIICFMVATASAEYRILAFGDSNTWGWKPDGGGTRFVDAERWAGLLEKELGEGYQVICDGLVARRTNLDGMTAGLVDGSFLNGAKTLPAAIARNAPVDLVILFLGTNDLQLGAERTAREVAEAVGELAELVSRLENLLYANYPAPEVWVIAPPAFGDLSGSSLKDLFSVGQTESDQLSSAFQAMAKERSLVLIDANFLFPDGIGSDGIHLNGLGHQRLAKAIGRKLLKSFETSQ
jgi:lysophospholipase L1-like esterase